MDWSNFGLAKLQVFSDKHGKIKKKKKEYLYYLALLMHFSFEFNS